jgi:CubicO group peptidase (beta-lactamase class C family)
VNDILGSDYEFIDEYRSKETTLRDLLSHRTGLARLDIGLFSGFPKSLSRKQLSMLVYIKQVNAVVKYSSFGFFSLIICKCVLHLQ